MLQNIRDRLTGPFVWFIVGLIVIPFAFFGIETFRTGGGDPTVAQVGDQKITQSQLKFAYEQRLRQLQGMLGDNFRPEQFDTPRFREAVLRDMTEEARLRQFARDAGYRASDASLFDNLSAIPAFQENGKFSSELYRTRLANQGYTPDRFEKQMRDSVIIDQLRAGVVETTFVPAGSAEQAWRLANQERVLSVARFESKRYLDRVTIEESQVQARYDEQKARFQEPERIKLAYVELSLDELKKAQAPTPEVLRVIYEADKTSRFSTPEERKARHILLNFGADKAAAKAKAEDLAQKIRGGTDFAPLAQSYSDDPGSKAKGGDLGWIKRGQMLEKFEQALFTLKKGQLSDPVETEFGWHLVVLDDVREAAVQPFEDTAVQTQLLEIYRSREAQRRYQEMSEKLEQLAFETPGSLEPVTQELGLAVQTTDWFVRGVPAGLFAHAAVAEAAFSPEVLKDGENSRPLAAGDNRVVVIRKADYQPPRQKELAEVSTQVRDELRQQGAKAKAQAEAAATLTTAQAGQPLELAAHASGGEFRSHGAVKREQADVDAAIRDALFSLPRPAEGKAVYRQVTLASGDVAVIGLTAVNEAAWPPANPADLEREKGKLKNALAGAEFSAYRGFVEKQVPTEIIQQPAAEQEPAE